MLALGSAAGAYLSELVTVLTQNMRFLRHVIVAKLHEIVQGPTQMFGDIRRQIWMIQLLEGSIRTN